MIETIIHFFGNIGPNINLLLDNYGTWAYFILFLIIFSETGLVIAPFLPGDSLLVAIGLFASKADAINIHEITALLILAAILGNTSNYWIGRFFHSRTMHKASPRFIKKKYLDQAHTFYEKYGASAIVLGRFLPVFRTFIPFIAGLAKMNHKRYQVLNIISAVLWVAGLMYLGYFFGNWPIVQRHFNDIILAILFISFLPILIKLARAPWKKR